MFSPNHATLSRCAPLPRRGMRCGRATLHRSDAGRRSVCADIFFFPLRCCLGPSPPEQHRHLLAIRQQQTVSPGRAGAGTCLRTRGNIGTRPQYIGTFWVKTEKLRLLVPSCAGILAYSVVIYPRYFSTLTYHFIQRWSTISIQKRRTGITYFRTKARTA